VFSAGYSKQFEKLLNKPFSAGAKLKSIQAKIGGYSASALAIDIGGYLKYNDELNLGAALKNFGTKMKFFTEKEDLPLCFSIGANYKVIPQLTLALDLSAPLEEDVRINFGVEYRYNILSLRAGYNSDNDLVNGLTNCGFGILYNNFKLDYAFLPFGDLGDSHKLSFSIDF